MTWNYRIIKHDAGSPVYFAIHEVYYDESGNVTNWMAEATDLIGESRKDLMQELEQIISDSRLPILEESKLLKS